jgi:hypothetical protein
MEDDPMTNAGTVAKLYIEAVGDKRFDQVEALLHPSVTFEAPERRMQGASAYVAALRKLAPVIARNEIKRVFVDGSDVCIVYDFVTDTSVGVVPSVEWLTVEGGTVRSIRLIFHSKHWGTVLEELGRRAVAA